MGLHAAIIRLSPLIHEGEQRYKPCIVGDPRMVTPPLKNPGSAPAAFWKTYKKRLFLAMMLKMYKLKFVLAVVVIKKNGIDSLPFMFHIKLTKCEHVVFPSYSFILWYHKLKYESHETDKSSLLSLYSLDVFFLFCRTCRYSLLCWIRFNELGETSLT